MNESVKHALKKYRSHKTVWAARIRQMFVSEGKPEQWELCLIGEDDSTVVITMPDKWVRGRKAEAGGFFVEYEDGYQSYSPAEPFLAGNTPVNEPEPAEDWRSRLDAERLELASRLEKLDAFIDGDDTGYSALPVEDRRLLFHQRNVMNEYHAVLVSRCQRAGLL